MPRANRYYQKNYVYHITHRCNHKNFYLKFKKDKSRYRYWLYQAVKKYHLSVLNYVITNNHIHLLVYDSGDIAIANSMRLIASRVSFEYNSRKQVDGGAFWQGRYFATAVQEASYLLNCMVYIDLNMVRCGVVSHPKAWPFGGYTELLQSDKRYRILDKEKILELSGTKFWDVFIENYHYLITSKLNSRQLNREPIWTETSAVGDDNFMSNFNRSKS